MLNRPIEPAVHPIWGFGGEAHRRYVCGWWFTVTAVDQQPSKLGRPARIYLAVSVVLGTGKALVLVAQASLLATVVAAGFVNGMGLAELKLPVELLLAVFMLRALVAWSRGVAANQCPAKVKSMLRAALVRRAVLFGRTRRRRAPCLGRPSGAGLRMPRGTSPDGLPALRSGDLLARLVGDVDAVKDLMLRVQLPDDDWDQAIRTLAETAHHFVRECRLGTERVVLSC